MIIVNLILITILIGICLTCVINLIDNKLLSENERLVEVNKQEKRKVDILINILREISRELKFTQLKECPKEELKTIPKEIIYWIDELLNGVDKECQQKEK